MKKILITLSTILILCGCVSSDKININQISSEYPIVLKKGRNSNKITAVKIPLVFEVSKKSFKKVQLANEGYWYNNKYFKRNTWGASVTTFHVKNNTLKENIYLQNINFRKKVLIAYTSHRPRYAEGDELSIFFKPYLEKMERENKDPLHIESISILKSRSPNIIENFLYGDSILFRICYGQKLVTYTYPIQVK